jgi:PTH1 family peptidyl-tRNA hydrolase
MYLIVGLGNPGTKYTLTRHNIGFLAIDALARSFNGELRKEEHKALTLKLKLDDQEVLLAKPQTYMNHSGESVVPLMQYYKIEPEHVLVIHDEIDLPFNYMKIQKNRGPGGHNGIKSITEQLGHQDFARIRLGVGRPSNTNIPVVDYVLQNFDKEEQTRLVEFLNRTGDAIESFIFDGFERAAGEYNQKPE